MKNTLKTIFMSMIIFSVLSLISTNSASAQGHGRISIDVFYNELSPYGYWENDPNYGEIWFPSVERDFRPYSTNGYWTMTQYGNTWVSHYPWGWAPFHYGRWVYTSYRGWGWIPGYEWGPAWVEWRSGNGYYGWAPMAPRWSVNVSIGLPINLWIFAPSRYIYDRHWYRHSHYNRPNIYNNTTIINNTYIVNNNHYYGGPSRRDIERSTGRRVTVRNVEISERPGTTRVDRNSVSIYRPEHIANNSSRRSNNNYDRGSSVINRNEGNVSKEMYIDRNGNTSIRDKNQNDSRPNNEKGATIDRRNSDINRDLNRNSNNNRQKESENSTSNRRQEREYNKIENYENRSSQRQSEVRPQQQERQTNSGTEVIRQANERSIERSRNENNSRSNSSRIEPNNSNNNNRGNNSSRGNSSERIIHRGSK